MVIAVRYVLILLWSLNFRKSEMNFQTTGQKTRLDDVLFADNYQHPIIL